MLRNHFGWASRSALALALLGVFPALTAWGGPLIGLPPLSPVAPGTTPTTTYVAPGTDGISGFVYVDSAGVHSRELGEWGISGVTITLQEVNGFTASVTTNSIGYYDFTNVPTGAQYTLTETQPSGFSPSASNPGNFLSSSGGTITATNPNTGTSAKGISVSTTQIGSIYMPPATGAFAPNSKGGQYTLVNEDFGDVGKISYSGSTSIGKAPTAPGVPGTGVVVIGGSTGMSVSLSAVGNNDRFLLGSALPITGSVTNTGGSTAGALNWQLFAATTGVGINPTSASGVAGGHSTPLSGSINSSSLGAGTQTSSITIHGNGTPSSVTANLTIDPVVSRTIDSVSSPATATDPLGVNVNFGRAMIGQSYSEPVTFNSAAPRDTTTDLTLNAGSFNTTTANANVTLNSASATTLNGNVTQANATLTITPTVSGPNTLLANFGTSPFTGETLAAGTPTLPNAQMPYGVIALEPRTLGTVSGDASTPIALNNPANTGGYLYGAVVSVPNGLVVTSTDPNPGPNNATWVHVAPGSNAVASISTADGVTPVGTVFPTQTTVNGTSSTTAVPLSITLESFGAVGGAASLNVATAESASVNDTTNYASVNLQYNAQNVGLAATGGTDPANSKNQLFGAPLIAVIPAGSALSPNLDGATLTSYVGASGSSGSASTTLNSPAYAPVTSTNYKSTLGTGADIVQSDVLPSGGTISMAWRNRNNDENGNFANDGNTSLPQGTQWLVSDVVHIGGLSATPNTAVAVQMSFNNDVNGFNESGTSATVQSSYLLELEGSTWVRASAQASPTENSNIFTGVADSLTDFLTTEEAAVNPKTGEPNTLDDLVGSWGVDLTNNESWAILNQGDVTLAVAPEPGTIALLIGGGVSLLAWRTVRRRRVTKARAATEAS